MSTAWCARRPRAGRGWYTGGVIMDTTRGSGARRLRLEPDDEQSSCPVLRGLGSGNGARLPDAYANRYSFVPPRRPRRPYGPRTGEATCRQLKPREQWIAIPVPAIVDQETWDRAQAQLARNAALSFRNNTKHNYLLRCLMTCAICGLAMFGAPMPQGGRSRSGATTSATA